MPVKTIDIPFQVFGSLADDPNIYERYFRNNFDGKVDVWNNGPGAWEKALIKFNTALLDGYSGNCDLEIIMGGTDYPDDVTFYRINSAWDQRTINVSNMPSETLIYTKTTTSAISYLVWPTFTIPITTDDLQYGISVKANKYLTLKNPRIYMSGVEPVITSVTVTSNKVSDTTVSFVGSEYTSFSVTASLNGSVIATNTGTTQTSTTFTTLTAPGEYTFTVTLKNTFSISMSANATLTYPTPTITTLEPSNIDKLHTNNITVTFAGSNITSWVLVVSQGGLTKHSDAGTTARSSTINAHVLTNGVVNMCLTATYTENGYSTTATKNATFRAYGPPQPVTLNTQSVYNSPRPILSWTDNEEQLAYRVVLSTATATVVDTTMTGTDNRWQPDDNLSILTTYQLDVYIKNSYNLWSEPATAIFTVDYSQLDAPQITAYPDNSNACNVIVVTSSIDTQFSHNQVYRRTTNGTWQLIGDNLPIVTTFRDYTCGSGVNYEYKCAAVSIMSAKTDSDIKTCTCSFHNTHISTPNGDKHVVLDLDVESKLSYVDDVTFQVYSGYSKPSYTGGGVKYAQASLEAMCDKATKDVIFTCWGNETVCVRDVSGVVLYGVITQPKLNYHAYGLYDISFNFTECTNEEVDLNVYNECEYNYFVERQW